MHVHVGVSAHRQDLLLSGPQLFDPDICSFSVLQKVLLQIDKWLKTHAEDYNWCSWLDGKRYDTVYVQGQELIVHYDAAVVAGCLRGSDLLSDYVSSFFVVVEQDRGVHISNTAQMLAAEVKFVK